jgi:hypothetical protein
MLALPELADGIDSLICATARLCGDPSSPPPAASAFIAQLRLMRGHELGGAQSASASDL